MSKKKKKFKTKKKSSIRMYRSISVIKPEDYQHTTIVAKITVVPIDHSRIMLELNSQRRNNSSIMIVGIHFGNGTTEQLI